MYIIQYAKKRKKNAEKISNCHFETIGHTLYSKDKTRRRALFVESAYINVTNSLDKIRLYFIFQSLKSNFWLKKKKRKKNRKVIYINE